ncbi:MAG TPA: methionine synthase [Chloroflexi bacterium]|nr:methionine synthase [Chloroflexota bacterium]
MNHTNRRYLDALAERVLIYDGAMGTNLEAQHLPVDCYGGEKYRGLNEMLNLTCPQAVERVHRAFLEVGVDVIETNTFRANRITLAEFGLADKVLEINRAAASLARRVADEYAAKTGQPRFVAGSIGPTGKLPSADDPDLSDISFDELADVFREQAVGLIQGGVDVLLLETSQDILEVKAAVHGILRAYEETGEWLPIQAQITMDTTGHMLLGTDIEAALAILEGLPIDVIGMNCSTGPEHMRPSVEFLGSHSPLPISVIPNAGLPINVDGEAVYPLEPEPFAEQLAEFVEKHGISVVGGCCGTTPAHLKALVERVHGKRRPARPILDIPRLASAVRAYSMRQEPPPLLIGERCNAQGSRKFKRLLLAEDWDGIIALARQQVEAGAHALDISVAVTERPDEAALMRTVVHKLTAAGIEVPLVIDTTEPEVMEAALKAAPGRCLLNSTHLESGPEKASRVLRLAKLHNAAVMLLTIDERGMAKTADRKVEVAKRLYDLAVNGHGLKPEDLVFDPLTFTLATGDSDLADAAKETLEAIRRIKAELPGVFTSLGVSNISFGLTKAARPVINSVFLYHAVQAGLDMAIVNPARITPYADIPEEERELAEDLIFNRRPDALQRVIEFYEGREARPSTHRDPLAGLPLEERLYQRIVHRYKEGIEADIDALVLQQIKTTDYTDYTDFTEEKSAESVKSVVATPATHEAAIHILNDILLPAMKEVGDKFGAGELILPFVLQSAEVMKKAVNHLERYLMRQEGVSKGTIVLATVYGDVHDIGKNLVKTILSNNGYTVIDLGKQVPVETIVKAAEEHNADAIGLSALLVSTSKQMPALVNELHRRGLHYPVLIGGAAINRRFGRRILLTEDGHFYDAGVFYCKDAFEGLAIMDALQDTNRRDLIIRQVIDEAKRELGQERASSGEKRAPRPRRRVPPAPDIPIPPFWGAKVVESISPEAVFPLLDKRALFRLSWGAKNARGEAWKKLQAEFEARLAQMQRQALREGWFHPQAVYGYWPCQADGDNLLVYDPASVEADEPRVLEIFTFPRQRSREGLCLADYFAPVDSGVMDVVAFQVVTVGKQATARFDTLQEAGEYTEAYFFHGLAVQTAEATAEFLHRHIRRELGLPPDRDKRYSWGYPAIPNLEDHAKVFRLLPAESALGMSLTAAHQLVPEQSTAAIVVHHPEAKYFAI